MLVELTKIQFRIQPVTTKTIHRYQGLSLDELVFDPTNVKKHGLTYIPLSRIQIKEKLFLLALLKHEKVYVDRKVHVKMNRLKIITTWIPLILQFKNLHNSCNYTKLEYNFFFANIMKTSIMITTFKCLISYVL
jgi:hypothetical protein